MLKPLLPLALLPITAPLLAQSVEADSVRSIDEVVVTARTPRSELVPMQQLSGAKLQALSVHSVADALRYFSGIQIKDYGGIGGLKTVNVRSLGSQHLGVFYDGVQIGNAQNGIVDLGRFALDNMELLSIYNGQRTGSLQSAKDYAASGSLYMQSRRPVFEAGKRQYFRLGVDLGSFTTGKLYGSWAYRLAPTLSLSTSGEMLYSSGRYSFRYKKQDGYDIQAMRENGDIRATRGEVGLWAKPSWGEYNLRTYVYNSERGYPGASVREEPGVFKHQDRQWDTNFFLQGKLSIERERYRLQALAKYAYDYLHYRSDPRLDVTTMYVDNRYHQQELYLSLAETLSLGQGWSLSLANDVQYNVLGANLPDFAEPRRLQVLSALSGAYKGKYLRLQASCLHTYVRDYRRSEGGRDIASVFTPSLHLALLPMGEEHFSLRAFYKHSYRFPTLNDLYYDLIGGTQLLPERAEQYNVGILLTQKHSSAHLVGYQVQADVYYNRVRDKIVAIPTANQFRWSMLNYGVVDIVGLDLSLATSLRWGAMQISPRVNYTYQQAREHSDVNSPWYGGQIPYVPWHSGSLVVGLAWRQWSANYSFIYTGERYHSQANIPEYYIQPWYTHDLSIGKQWQVAKLRLRTTVELNNLLGQDYEVVRNYPMPGFNFKLKLHIYV